MAGRSKGVATKITGPYPKALYTHCAAHWLNLCVVKVLHTERGGQHDEYSRYNSSLIQQFTKVTARFGILDTVDLPKEEKEAQRDVLHQVGGTSRGLGGLC